MTLIPALRTAERRRSILARRWYSSHISTARLNVWLRWSTSCASSTLLWESIRAYGTKNLNRETQTVST